MNNVSPCTTLAIMSKKTVSLSGERTIAFVFLLSIVMAATVSFGDHMLEVFVPSSVCVWS